MERLYVKDLAKEITEKGIKEDEAGMYTLAKLNENIARIQGVDTRKLISSWYRASAIASCKIIVKNKFLLIETLLRAL